MLLVLLQEVQSTDDYLAFCTTHSFWMLSSAAKPNVAGYQVPVEHAERYVTGGNAVMVLGQVCLHCNQLLLLLAFMNKVAPNLVSESCHKWL